METINNFMERILTLETKYRVATNMIDMLQHIHLTSVHGNIKPDNILVNIDTLQVQFIIKLQVYNITTTINYKTTSLQQYI